MIQTLLVFLGGGLGAAARHGVNILAARWLGVDYPWGTIIINITGSIVMGMLTAWFAFRSDPFWSQEMRLLATTGFLGGYTTFSTFSLDAALMWERHDFTLFAGYVAASVALSIIGLFAGLWLVRSLT